ncbi:MAG: DNA starvation/stationary phase protection protein [Verrucomicrobiota bacterium]
MSTTTTESATATAEANSAIINGLVDLLADTYQLIAQTHLVHWNVIGTDFFQLHVALQGQYEEMFTAADDVAERVRGLDAFPPGGLSALAKISPIAEMESRLPAKEFVAGLILAHEKLVERAINLRSICGDAGDDETQDLVIGRIQVHQKTLWMLKSYLG